MEEEKDSLERMKQETKSKGNNISEKIITVFIILIIFIALISLIYTIKSVFFPAGNEKISEMAVKVSRMSLTPFDVQLAKQFMDKDSDGKCDVCGMDVELCIDGGQLQCNMDSHSTIGILDSQHIHSDFKVYVNGKALDFSDKAHMERMQANLPVSSFVHVDSGSPAPEKTGDILHMHATGVPLWIFFDSIGMEFDKNCLTLDTGEKYCNNAEKSLKFYVNGQLNNEYENYISEDLDKILISYGNVNEDVTEQLNSITDFAKIH